MQWFLRRFVYLFFFPWMLLAATAGLRAQTAAGTITGTVTDASGAVIPGAKVTIENPVSGLSRKITTDAAGQYRFGNLPFNSYHMVVNAPGFAVFATDVPVRSAVIVTPSIKLQVGGASTTVTVTSDDLLENDTSLHSDIDRSLIEKLPLESASSSVSSLVTLSTPGVSADSNGLFHGLGDHASNQFSVDGQPITDQQSKVFSNQIPSNSIQSIQVIAGAPPAEYGDKTSLVIQVTTRSGQGLTKPTGSITSSYGTFGSATGGFDLGYGSQTWGNFFELDGLNTGRFLDAPEFVVFHDKGNEQNVFDRVDYQFTPADAIHLNLNYSRSWFQTPNTYDNLNVLDQFGNDVGDTDQHSKIETFDIAPTYTRIMGKTAVFNFGPYIRKDSYQYFPSENPLADLGPPNLQTQTIGQYRTLTNAGAHADLTYTKGNQSIKGGVFYADTFLRENDRLAIVSPTFNSPCLNGEGEPVSGFTSPDECAAGGLDPNAAFKTVLLPYDLTRAGGDYAYFGHADVKELALYLEDSIKAGNWLFNLGIRGDIYNGLASARQAEPRVGLSYSVKRTSTVLRLSYARTLETPFNENLVLSSEGCGNDVLSPLLLCSPGVQGTLQPGFRNEFHAGFQQAFGKNIVVSGEYIWKYTHNAFDFSVLGNTPITFPIDWHNSKIPGFAMRADVPNYHHISAFAVLSSVSARFFPPQVAGAGATVGQPGFPFRIDHDERFNQTTHVQYQLPFPRSPWIGFNWRYDSGQVAGSVPCYNPLSNDPNSSCPNTSTLLDGEPAVDLSGLTADQEFQAGLTCDGIKATPTTPLPTPCPASQYSSALVKIPAPGTATNDKNPPRVQPRNLFDVSLGDDNLFKGDRYKWSLQLTGVNMTNKYALYNFLSTFSGTHYVTPRSLTAELGFHF
ncbi:MAG: TonB-dependent receptor [Acidobacteriaceae bacterium]